MRRAKGVELRENPNLHVSGEQALGILDLEWDGMRGGVYDTRS